MTTAWGTAAASKPAFGTWTEYGGAGRIELAVVLLVIAAALGAAAVRGWPRPRPAPARPHRQVVTVILVVFWFLALAAWIGCVAVYLVQARHDFRHLSAPSDPIFPVTFIGSGAVFITILITSRRRFPVTLGGAVVGAMAGPVIFELPFDLIVMARTYPAIDPHPALYRVLFFAPLFLIELITLGLLTRSPLARPSPATGGLLALMLALFAVWALDGFGYPSAPLPIALNVVSKLAALAAALSLFLPPSPAAEITPDGASLPASRQQNQQ